jgi:hypothetical protein
MFDIKSLENEARKEVNEEILKKNKDLMKTKLKAIATAKQVVKNLEIEYEALLMEISKSTV